MHKRKSPTESLNDRTDLEVLLNPLKKVKINNTNNIFERSTNELNPNENIKIMTEPLNLQHKPDDGPKEHHENNNNHNKLMNSAQAKDPKHRISINNNNNNHIDRFLDTLSKSEKTKYTLAKENLMPFNDKASPNYEDNMGILANGGAKGGVRAGAGAGGGLSNNNNNSNNDDNPKQNLVKNLFITYKSMELSMTDKEAKNSMQKNADIQNLRDARKLVKLSKLGDKKTDMMINKGISSSTSASASGSSSSIEVNGKYAKGNAGVSGVVVGTRKMVKDLKKGSNNNNQQQQQGAQGVNNGNNNTNNNNNNSVGSNVSGVNDVVVMQRTQGSSRESNNNLKELKESKRSSISSHQSYNNDISPTLLNNIEQNPNFHSEIGHENVSHPSDPNTITFIGPIDQNLNEFQRENMISTIQTPSIPPDPISSAMIITQDNNNNNNNPINDIKTDLIITQPILKENKWLKKLHSDKNQDFKSSKTTTLSSLNLASPIRKIPNPSLATPISCISKDSIGNNSRSKTPLRSVSVSPNGGGGGIGASGGGVNRANSGVNNNSVNGGGGSLNQIATGGKNSCQNSAKTRRSASSKSFKIELLAKCQIELENYKVELKNLKDDFEEKNSILVMLNEEKEKLILMKEELEKDKQFLMKKNECIMDYLKQKDLILMEKNKEINELKDQLNLSEYYRVNLHSYLQEIRGNLRIFCRVKPIKDNKNLVITFPEKEKLLTQQQQDNTNTRKNIPLRTLEISSGSSNNGQNQKRTIFFFDRVFDPFCTQSDIFEEIIPFIQSAIDGDQVCILAYGQTGSGKTFTMEGPNLISGTTITPESGILPRAVDFIFKEKKRLEYQGKKMELQMACIEIYNDNLSDLLANDSATGNTSSGASGITGTSSGGISNGIMNINQGNQNFSINNGSNTNSNSGQTNEKLMISFQNGKVIVNGLTWVYIQDNQQLLNLVIKASKSRMVEKTNWNERSSRSHCIYKLRLIHNENKEGLLNIVDLAGSERCDPNSFEQKTTIEINQMKKIQNEANFINKSLTTMGRIIRLISEKKSTSMIPYRESKLTRLLQDSLGGNAKTLMFINVCPSEENAFQSKESLKFSSKISL